MTMLVGDKSLFAVEWNVNETVDNWVFGNFLFWIKGSSVGDPSDCSVDLLAVTRWVKAFLAGPQDRFEEGLFSLPREQAYERLAASVLFHEDPENRVKEHYPDTFARFHITHIGMSSFDVVTVLLVKDEDGSERCIWKDGSQHVVDAYLPANEIERILSQFLLHFDPQP